MANEDVIPSEGTADVKTVKILIDSEEVDAKYQIEGIFIHKEVNRVPFARITIFDGSAADRKFEISDSGIFDPGKLIEIKAGYNGDDETVFKGVIVRQGVRIGNTRKNSVLKIEAKDEFVGLCVGRKSAYFYKSKDSDIVEDILAEHEKNYKANVNPEYKLKKKISSTKVKHEEMVQYYASDWDFIVTRAEKNGMLVLVNDGEFVINEPKLSAKPIVKLTLGANIFDFESELDAISQYGMVETNSWNISDQKELIVESEEPKLEEQGKLSGEDLSKVLGSASINLSHVGNVINTEMQEWANAKLLKARLAKLRGRVKCQGFSKIKVGDVIELIGFGDHFNGKVYVSAIRHTIAGKNWELDIQFGLEENWFSSQMDIVDSPAAGLVPAVNGLHIGVVTQIQKDPDSEFRLLVRAPMISDKDDGIWARVSQLDAGNNRGTYFRPEIGDEVVLGFLNADPRDPIVLGSLNSSKNPSPFEPKDDNDEKGIVTRSEMKVTFDDKDKIIYVQTADDKNKIRLDEKEKGIYIEDEHGNKIEMTSDGITLDSASDITLKASGDVIVEGTNIEGKAKSKVAFDGKSGAELTSNGIAVLKGNLVKIN